MKTIININRFGLGLAVLMLACLPTAPLGAKPSVIVGGDSTIDADFTEGRHHHDGKAAQSAPLGAHGNVTLAGIARDIEHGADGTATVTAVVKVVILGQIQIKTSGQDLAQPPNVRATAKGGQCRPGCIKIRQVQLSQIGRLKTQPQTRQA